VQNGEVGGKKGKRCAIAAWLMTELEKRYATQGHREQRCLRQASKYVFGPVWPSVHSFFKISCSQSC